MTLDENEIRQRLRLGEDSRTEFKEFEFRGNRPIRPERRSIADELGAFANARGGVMYCGVTDDGEVHGMPAARWMRSKNSSSTSVRASCGSMSSLCRAPASARSTRNSGHHC